MDAYDCPEKTTVNLPPHHRAIVNNAMRSGRYGSVSEFFRECIEENGERRGFAPDENSLSPRAGGAGMKTASCPRCGAAGVHLGETPLPDGNGAYEQYQCLNCGHGFLLRSESAPGAV